MRDKSTYSYPFVSIITLNYNGEHYLADLFRSLEQTDYPKDKLEIIMGDNGSTDKSVEYVETHFSFVKILSFDKNYGFCKGNNLCVKYTKGKYLVFLNTDTVVTKNWLKNLVNAVISEKSVISAGSKLLKPYKIDGKKIIDYAGGKITYSLGLYEGIFDYDAEKYSIQKYTGFGCGAAVLVDKTFFIRIGGFDEYYFGGGEETEIGLRAWQYGYRVLYVPSSIVFHLRGVSFKKIGSFPTYAWVKSILYFILKNSPKKHIFINICESIIFIQFPRLLVFALKRDFSSFSSVIKGIYDFIVELKRKDVLSTIYYKRQVIGRNEQVFYKDLKKIGILTSFNERLRYGIKLFQNWRSAK